MRPLCLGYVCDDLFRAGECEIIMYYSAGMCNMEKSVLRPLACAAGGQQA
jgi:hypothetical protein